MASLKHADNLDWLPAAATGIVQPVVEQIARAGILLNFLETLLRQQERTTQAVKLLQVFLACERGGILRDAHDADADAAPQHVLAHLQHWHFSLSLCCQAPQLLGIPIGVKNQSRNQGNQDNDDQTKAEENGGF